MKRSPLKRKRRLRPKRKRARMLWRTGRVMLDAQGMADLRSAVFARSGGRCEQCGRRISWARFHLHHKRKRSQGGSDSEENCTALCLVCHGREHGLRIVG